jgi:tetratricopeptide (TPR) repeat protein
VAQGKDKAALQAEDVLKDWAAFECGYVDRNAWIEYLAEGLTRGDSAPPSPEAFMEAMYYALKTKGVEGAIARYREIKARGLGGYRPDENGAIYIPYKLYENGKYAEALPFFELCASEYPQGQYTTYCYNRIGDIHAKMGNKDLARQSYKKCLEIDPSDARAARMLEDLDEGD